MGGGVINRFRSVWRFLTKPRLVRFGVPCEQDVSISLSQIVLRALIGLFTVSWIGSIPFYLFVIYMHENKLFSYDFFRDGVFGLYTFVFVSSIFIVLLSLAFYGFVIWAKVGLTQLRREGKNHCRGITWFFFGISCFMHYIFFLIAMDAGRLTVLLWLMAISAIFCLFFCSFAGHGFKRNAQNWMSPLAFICLSAFLPFANQDVTAEVVAMGLRGFNVGGGKNIVISQKDERSEIRGKLSLLSPQNAYLKDSKGRLKIVPLTASSTVVIW